MSNATEGATNDILSQSTVWNKSTLPLRSSRVTEMEIYKTSNALQRNRLDSSGHPTAGNDLPQKPLATQ